MRFFGLGKYRVIVLTVAMFLVFDLGVLVLNFVISSQIAADALAVNMAGRQRMLSQRAAKTLWQISERAAAGQPAGGETAELAEAVSLFDETLTAFLQGGSIHGGAGTTVTLARIDDADGIAILQRANAVWAPYRARITTLLANPAPSVDEVRSTLDVARSANLELLKLMNELTSQVEVTAAAKATTLRAVQIGGITLATANFVLILFHFLRKLRQGDALLEQAKKETDDILVTVNEGLFLLGRDFRIGSQHSQALEAILGRKDLGGADFVDLLRGIVTEKTVGMSRDYLDLLFGERVNEKLVSSLNPLDVVEVHFDDQRGGFVTKYLEFRFNRVREGGVVAHLLVTANDVTKRVQLERALKEAHERAKGQMDLLVEVLQVEPDALRDFLAAAALCLDKVNTLLRERTASATDRREAVIAIYRLLHGLKGDASGVGLSGLAEAIHDVEDLVVALREKHASLDGNDFLPLAVRLERLFAQVDALRGVVNRFAQIRGVVAVEPARPATETDAAQAPLVVRWREFATRLAEKHGKHVHFHYHGIDPGKLASPYREALPTVINQFIRNAVVHGVEAPAQRLIQGKPAVGNLALYLAARDDGGVDLSFRDDGAGLQLAAIRQAAIDRGLLSAAEADACDARRLVELIFKPAFSTRASADEDGGRGVGLDVIRAHVNEWGGNIRIGSTPREYCHFRISLPRPSPQLSAGAAPAHGEAA